MTAPLTGYTVVEMAGLGPAPFCSMMLSDMGARVIRIDAKTGSAPLTYPHPRFDITARGRHSIAMDLKKSDGVALALRLIERADVLIEGFRPGVMERLGLGPEICLARNPRLVYGRMTGWGQTGPLAQAAGHDLNYLALTGALQAMGRADEPPPVPLNLVGDYGGGAMMMAYGISCALLETQRSGQGQVIDAAMTDGVTLLSSLMFGLKAAGIWRNQRTANFLDGAAHFYDTYECADGRYVALAALEPHFFRQFCEKAGLEDIDLRQHMDRRAWAALKPRIAALFLTRTRAAWCELLEGTDCCCTPVLDWDEAAEHPHNRARETFVEIDGVRQPAPAPRLSRTPARVQGPPPARGEHTQSVLAEFGFGAEEIDALRTSGTI